MHDLHGVMPVIVHLVCEKVQNVAVNVAKQSLADLSELLVVFVTFFKDFF